MFIDFLVTAILSDVRCYLTVVLVCLSLIISNVEHLFMCLLASSMSTLEKWLFRASTHFSFLFLSFFFFFLNGFTHGIWKFLGQRLNLNHSCNLYHSCGNTLSFNPLCQARDWTHVSTVTQAAAVRFWTCCTTVGTPCAFLFFFLAAQWHREFPGQGSDLSCSYELNHSWDNTRSLTHCARLGIKLAFQCSSDAADPVVP